MVQELQVLKCFSCETFQSHIVKKTNKWECKVCGAKQSVKKVYGRGSGKDCRIHTQKLNALRGVKEETEGSDKYDKEISIAEQPVHHFPVIDGSSSSAYPGNNFKKSSKWAEFMDEDETRANQDDFPNTDDQSSSTRSIICHSEGKKRKSKEFSDESEGYSDNFNFDYVNNSTLHHTHNKKIKLNRHIQVKKCSHSNKKIYIDYGSQGVCEESAELVNNTHFKNKEKSQTSRNLTDNPEVDDQTNRFKIPSQNNRQIVPNKTKVSWKWAKYLDEEEDLSFTRTSPMKTSHQSENEDNVSIELQKNTKVGRKWAEYLDEEKSCRDTTSMNTSTSLQFENEDNVSTKKFNCDEGERRVRDSGCSRIAALGHFRNGSLDYSGGFSSDFEDKSSIIEIENVISKPLGKVDSSNETDKISFKCPLNSDAHSSSNWITNYCISKNIDSFSFEKEKKLKNEFNKDLDKSVAKVNTEKENSNFQSTGTGTSLPVFEQDCELSDSDFQLDF